MGLRPNDSGSGRTYSWGDEVFVSVTTVIGCLNKPALPGWAARSAAEFAVKNIDIINDMISRADPKAAIDMIKAAPWRQRETAADVGSVVHKAVESILMGTEPQVSEVEVPYLAQFVRFMEAFKPEILVSEGTIFNRKYNYAGTLDLILKFDGITWLVDIKSGKGVYPETAMQIAAYSRGEFIGKDDGTEDLLPIIDKGGVLHLAKDRYEFIPVNIGKEIFESFLFCREMFRWQDQIASTALLPTIRK